MVIVSSFQIVNFFIFPLRCELFTATFTMNLNIPRISITSDTDDTDLSRLNIQEAVTDIEDLDIPKQKKKRKRNKAKVNQQVIENDLTDVEDIEGSGDELQTKIISHANPMKLDDLNMDQGYIMESYNSKNQKGYNQLNTHVTRNAAKNRNFLKSDYDETEGITDVEDIYASDDEASHGSSVPDTELPLEYDDNVVTDSTKHDMRRKSVSMSPIACYSDCDSDHNKPNRKHTNSKLLLVNATVNNIITDQEMLSDSADEAETKKVKKVRRRRPKGSMRNRGAVTDIEDVDLTIEDAKKSNVFKRPNKESKRKPFHQTESMMYFSDNEDCEFLEPKVKPKPTLGKTLALPSDADLGLTDVDDLDVSDVEEYTYDCTAIEKKIAILTDTCGEISEQSQPKVKLASAENSDADDDDQYYDIHFKTIPKNDNLLCIPLEKPAGETDVEDLDSDEASIIKIAYVKKITKHDTDIEEFSDDDCHLITHKKKAKLPESKRDLIIIKENKTGKPTVVVLPLDEYVNNELIAEAATDLEDFSDEDNFLSPCPSRRCSTPNVIQLDGGVIYDHQGVSKFNDASLEDTLTDTEDLNVKTKPNPVPKKLGNRLFIPGKAPRYNTCQEVKTDVEDLSDDINIDNDEIELDIHQNQLIPQCDGTTDIENFEASDLESVYRPISPDEMGEIDSTYIITMEGANKTEHLLNIPKFGCNQNSFTPNQTECEDMQASCEEDLAWYSDHSSSEIRQQLNENCWSQVNTIFASKLNMAEEAQWLRCGPLPQPLTDVESLDDDVVEATEDYGLAGNI